LWQISRKYGYFPKSRYFAAIGFSSVQTVADRPVGTNLLLNITSTSDELSAGIIIGDFKRL